MYLTGSKNFFPIFVYDSSPLSLDERHTLYELNPKIYPPHYYISTEEYPFTDILKLHISLEDIHWSYKQQILIRRRG